MTAFQPRALVLFALLSASSLACRAPVSSHAYDGKAIDAIRELDASFPRLTEKRAHKELVASYYIADALFMPPNMPAVVGRDAIQAALEAWPPISDFVLNTEEVVVRGDLAYSCGTYSMTLTPRGAAPIRDVGKFLEIFRRQPDGNWKVTRDIYNSDLPATAE
ncbi:MAG: DUF4440 domain-containing protein [Planctomycetes bacterium]|nr:DUF4440 domain-containing protein [Planctomycetota bacterium]